MFILNFIPDFVFHLLLLVGVLGIVASFVLSYMPFISQYRLPIQVASGLLIVFSTYMEGGISNNNAWLARVAELEKKVAEAEAKSADANTKLESKLAKRKEKIESARTATKEDIAKNKQAIDQECKLSTISLQLYNQAVKGAAK